MSEKKYSCPFCEDFETDVKEYLYYHWEAEEECNGCPCDACNAE